MAREIEEQQQQQVEILESEATSKSVACQTESNFLDKLIYQATSNSNSTTTNQLSQQYNECDLYQEYVRSTKCAQFWPLDKNPVRTLVPSMVKVDLPEHYLKNESLMFDLVQAIVNNSKMVNLLAKYLHHIVPNVIISKRVDLIPLIICTIRVVRSTSEQESLINLLFNLIKRPNEEQRRMILSGLVVILQATPQQSPTLLPRLWDHVNDKFPERRLLLAESCATLAHYVRPAMRTNLILSILLQLLQDKNTAVRSVACRSFACLLTLIMDRNDEVFDACTSAAEDIIKDILHQPPANYCENRGEIEQMSFCALEAIFPLLCIWAVKLNRFKVEIGEFYLAKAGKYFSQLSSSSRNAYSLDTSCNKNIPNGKSLFTLSLNEAMIATPRIINGYLKLLKHLIPFVFTDAVNSCGAWSKNNTSSQWQSNPPDTEQQKATVRSLFERPFKCKNQLLDPSLIIDETSIIAFHEQVDQERNTESLDWIFDVFLPRFIELSPYLSNKKLHDIGPDVVQDILYNLTSSIQKLCLLLGKPLTRTRIRPVIRGHMKGFDMNGNDTKCKSNGISNHNHINHNHLEKSSSLQTETQVACQQLNESLNQNSNTSQHDQSSDNAARRRRSIFGRSSKQRVLVNGHHVQPSCWFPIYLASLTAFEPIEQQELAEIVSLLRSNLDTPNIDRLDVETIAISIKLVASSDQIHSPSTRQKFLNYILDTLAIYSNNCTAVGETREHILIIYRHILTCLIDPVVRPPEWSQLLVSKFLPYLITLANDATDVYICTCSRLMCAQLVETFESFLHDPSLTNIMAEAILPALITLRSLTEQIKASNLNRQIVCLIGEMNKKFCCSQLSTDSSLSDSLPFN